MNEIYIIRIQKAFKNTKYQPNKKIVYLLRFINVFTFIIIGSVLDVYYIAYDTDRMKDNYKQCRIIVPVFGILYTIVIDIFISLITLYMFVT